VKAKERELEYQWHEWHRGGNSLRQGTSRAKTVKSEKKKRASQAVIKRKRGQGHETIDRAVKSARGVVGFNRATTCKLRREGRPNAKRSSRGPSTRGKNPLQPGEIFREGESEEFGRRRCKVMFNTKDDRTGHLEGHARIDLSQ